MCASCPRNRSTDDVEMCVVCHQWWIGPLAVDRGSAAGKACEPMRDEDMLAAFARAEAFMEVLYDD